jgi:uncharacterized protein YgiM (DUF1202 family)
MKFNRALFSFVLLLLLAGCSIFAGQPTATPTPPPVEPSATIPPIQSSTPLPQPTFTPSPTPFEPFEAHTSVDNTNLRTGPGYLFTVDRLINQNVTFQVLGKCKGGEWFFVKTSAGNEGWVFGQLIQTDQDLQSAPELQVQDAQLITGQLADNQGKPISGIQFAITQSSAVSSQRTDAITDTSGTFYAYMPTSASGVWTVAYTAVSCKSNTMDANCNCLGGVCGAPDPLSQTVSLPQSQPLEFTWK